MEQALLISPLFILLAGLVFHAAAAHRNPSPVITPFCYVPQIYILLIPFRILLASHKENKNRFRLLLKTASSEIPENTSHKFKNSLKVILSPSDTSILHPERTSPIYKALMNRKAALHLLLRSDELREKLKLSKA